MEYRLLKKMFNTSVMVSGLMIVSLFIFVLVALMVIQAPVMDSGVPLPLFRYLLYGIALVEIAMIFILRRRLLERPGQFSPRSIENMQAYYEKKQVHATEEEIIHGQRLFTVSLISFALAESVAVYGFVLFLLTGSHGDLYLLTGLALIVMLALFPGYDRWLAHIKEMKRKALRQKAGVKQN